MLDVDAMLEAMTPQQFARWRAFGIVEGWGQEWERAGTVAAAAHNAVVLLTAATAGIEPKEEDFADAEDFVPKPKGEHRSKGPKVLSDAESKAQARVRYG